MYSITRAELSSFQVIFFSQSPNFEFRGGKKLKNQFELYLKFFKKDTYIKDSTTSNLVIPNLFLHYRTNTCE